MILVLSNLGMLDFVFLFYYFRPLWSVEERELCPHLNSTNGFFSNYESYIVLSSCVSHPIGLFYDIYIHTNYNLVFNVGRLWSYYAEPPILLTDIKLLQFVPCRGVCKIVKYSTRYTRGHSDV